MFIEVFDLPEFAEYGYVVWPDLWNARMADDGNTEAQYYGDSARPGHILWEVFGVSYNASDPKHTYAADTLVVLLSKKRHWDVVNLAMLFCTDPGEYGKWFYFSGHGYGAMCAEKDSHKWALLALNRSYHS